MSGVLKTACIQLSSGPDIHENLEVVAGFVREAESAGARLIVTPENTCHIRYPADQKLKSAFTPEDHPGIPLFAKLAKEHQVWILAGSFSVLFPDGKIANRSYLFSEDGEISATYDKIHLFDAELSGGEVHRESDIMQAGDKAVVAQTPWGGLGLSICYDLRFPYLYRAMARAGATIMAVPSAFTVPTGRAHWEILLRARAIETGSFVLAAAQVGTHENGRRTWGHSMIISPWGEVLACRNEDGPGVLYADLHLNHVMKARRSIPVLEHERNFELETV